ncbi:MAG: hypothetical protein GEU91_12295 [Rhizobiales bacterium]|nr:hypothetical protein [Hyphomicrobiales bacterium]
MAKISQSIAAAALLLAGLGQAHAQATRTWVSGVGDDANPCSRTAPCKTFAGAISKTAAGGEISVLDPGGYGAVTITKAVSITNDGSGEAGILASLTNGVVINAGVNDVVILRGLIIDGAPPTSPGLNGIRFLAGGALHVENCVIKNFKGGVPNGSGIQIVPNAGMSRIFVSNCSIVNNVKGVEVKPTGAGIARVVLDRLQVNRNTGAGLVADGSRADVWVNNSIIAANAPGVSAINNGLLQSYGNNVLANNSPNGKFSSVVPLK